jgi:hypothetical protein
MSARRAWLALAGLGVALLIPFEWPLTIVLGIGCLLGFVAWGTFLIATPDLLSREDDEHDAVSSRQNEPTH